MQKDIMEREIAEIIKGFRQDSIEIEIEMNQEHVHLIALPPAREPGGGEALSGFVCTDRYSPEHHRPCLTLEPGGTSL